MSHSRISGSNIDPESISATQLSQDSVITSRIADSAVTTAKIAADAVTQAKIADDAVGLAQVEDATLDGTVAKVVANVNVIGGLPVLHRVTCTALSGDVDVTLTHKTRVVDVWAVATALGGVGDTVTVKNGANAISNALDLNVADTTVVRAGTLDDAQWDVAAAGTLRVTGASAVNAEVYIWGIRVA